MWDVKKVITNYDSFAVGANTFQEKNKPKFIKP